MSVAAAHWGLGLVTSNPGVVRPAVAELEVNGVVGEAGHGLVAEALVVEGFANFGGFEYLTDLGRMLKIIVSQS